MSTREHAKAQAQQKMVAGPLPSGRLLQRTCACGGSPGIDGLCTECRDKRLAQKSTQRVVESPSATDAVPGSTLVQEQGPSFDSAFEKTSRFKYDFSRIPIHSPAIQRKLATDRPGDVYEPQDNVEQSIDQVRHHAEVATNYDLSDTQIKPNSSLATAAGVEALTFGKEIHLASGRYQPNNAQSKHVLAHELAHVVQQGTGETVDIGKMGRRGQLEAQAESMAHRINGVSPTNSSMRTLSVPAYPVVQAFDPRYHRESVIEGLVGTGFSSKEIGDIYAANWERDFSQAHPALAAIVLAWKAVKIAASEDRLTDNEIKNFERSVDNLVNMIPFGIGALMNDEAYGGYRFYEHMDNPDNPALSARVSVGTTSIPQYMLDSREYIKAQLFRAVEAYRRDTSPIGRQSESGQIAADFEKRAKELTGIVKPGHVASGSIPATSVGIEAKKQAEKVPVTEMSFEEGDVITAQRPRRSPRTSHPPKGATEITMPPETIIGHVPTGPVGHWNATVADGLGRASHALEDFFAHSNFVEIAIGEVDPKQGLSTGTFGKVDKKHSLSHKIRALADEIDAEMPLVNRVLGRTTKNPEPSQVHLGSTTAPTHEQEQEAPHSMQEALGETGSEAKRTIAKPAIGGLALGVATGGLLGGLLGSFLGPIGTVVGAIGGGLVGGIIGGIIGLRSGIKSAARNVIATPRGVEMLRRVAAQIEEETHEKALPGSHTAMAKDQPGHDDSAFGRRKTAKFQLAQQLAAAADRMVLGAMHQVLDAPSPESADVLLLDVYKELDALINLPNSSHPLYHLIEPSREKITK